jgi:hypothetical protein
MDARETTDLFDLRPEKVEAVLNYAPERRS